MKSSISRRLPGSSLRGRGPDEVASASDDKTEAVTNAESNQLEVLPLWSLNV
jgi:hypothetical protein